MKNRIQQCRTFRIFKEDQRIRDEFLFELIDGARLGGSARNCQPWQYLPVADKALCEKIFPSLGWAGYLSDWSGPAPGERPAAYLLCFLNTKWLKGPETEASFDLGVASQNMLLMALEQGVGGCRVGTFNSKITDLFSLPDYLQLKLVIALGVPAETVVLEEGRDESDIRYWRDDKGVHHVPKRKCTDIVLPQVLAD